MEMIIGVTLQIVIIRVTNVATLNGYETRLTTNELLYCF